MKKVGFVFIFAFLLVALVIFVSAATSEEINQAISNAAGVDVSENVKGFIGDFVQKRGIQPEQVKGVSQVDFNSLPKAVNIQGVGDHNLAIYQVDFENENAEQEKVFVVGYSVEELRAQGDLIVAQDKRNFLNFGSIGMVNNSTFLSTATGVATDEKKGYVMTREGSITGLSTNLEVIGTKNSGKIEIRVLKNGKPVSFGNTLATSNTGIKNDYDVQSKGVVDFGPGDVISAYAQTSEGTSFRDAIVLIEITTVN